MMKNSHCCPKCSSTDIRRIPDNGGMRAETISIQPQLHYSGRSQLSVMYVVTAVMWRIG